MFHNYQGIHMQLMLEQMDYLQSKLSLYQEVQAAPINNDSYFSYTDNGITLL